MANEIRMQLMTSAGREKTTKGTIMLRKGKKPVGPHSLFKIFKMFAQDVYQYFHFDWHPPKPYLKLSLSCLDVLHSTCLYMESLISWYAFSATFKKFILLSNSACFRLFAVLQVPDPPFFSNSLSSLCMASWATDAACAFYKDLKGLCKCSFLLHRQSCESCLSQGEWQLWYPLL